MKRLPSPGMKANCGLDMFGIDFWVTINFRVTFWGAPATYYDPEEYIEYEIDKIVLQSDTSRRLGPEFEATGELFETLCNLSQVKESCDEVACDYTAWDD